MTALSISLAVANIERAQRFYEALGFEVIDGGHLSAEFPDSETSAWRMLALGESKVGLFQGMFSHNMMTLHGVDVEHVKQALNAAGFAVDDPHGIEDPDGNAVLLEA